MTRRCALLRVIAVSALAVPVLLPSHARGEDQCSGHELLAKPRPEASCRTLTPQNFVAPDKTIYASVLPVDVSLYATPDMESRIVIRLNDGKTLTSKDHASPRGTNGYYVVNAKWSPDSQFFVYSTASSGGHSPWSFPMWVYSRKVNAFAAFSDMIKGPTVSGGFKFSGPHTVTAETWQKPGSPEDKVPVRVDLEQAFARLKPSPN
jgi:hypothetical protein